MRKPSRRFPNGVTVWVEAPPGGRKKYTAEKDGVKIGYYRVERSGFDNPTHSHGRLGGKPFISFYDWLRAARGAGL